MASRQILSALRNSFHGARGEVSYKPTPAAPRERVADNPQQSDVPPIVFNVLKSAGRSLDRGLQESLKPDFGVDLDHVRLHTDEAAVKSAQAMNARAFTVGNDVVFNDREFSPTNDAGRRLIRHELAHVLQNRSRPTNTLNLKLASVTDAAEREAQAVESGRGGAGPRSVVEHPTENLLFRVPVPPTYQGMAGSLNRSKVTISEIPDVVAKVAGDAVSLTPAAVTATVSISDPAVSHISWELYDPSDQLIDGFSTLDSNPQPTSKPFLIDGPAFHGSVSQGRYTLRCVGRKNGHPLVYADRTFFLWTKAPPSMQDSASLAATAASPSTHTLGEVGAAKARGMMLEHQASIQATGKGKYMGANISGGTPTGVAREDCTTYVLEVLKSAFDAKGLSAQWNAVSRAAQQASGAKLKGTELLKALTEVAGWKAVFWAPDPRHPADSQSEHPVANRDVQSKGTYYGIPVDKAKSVVDYGPTSPTAQPTMTRLDQLRQVPLGVIAAHGGEHMTLLLNGDVYEVHWTLPATDPNVIQATPLEKWAWLSGVVVMPAGSFIEAFR